MVNETDKLEQVSFSWSVRPRTWIQIQCCWLRGKRSSPRRPGKSHPTNMHIQQSQIRRVSYLCQYLLCKCAWAHPMRKCCCSHWHCRCCCVDHLQAVTSQLPASNLGDKVINTPQRPNNDALASVVMFNHVLQKREEDVFVTYCVAVLCE